MGSLGAHADRDESARESIKKQIYGGSADFPEPFYILYNLFTAT
jgi:hypothetical protein